MTTIRKSARVSQQREKQMADFSRLVFVAKFGLVPRRVVDGGNRRELEEDVQLICDLAGTKFDNLVRIYIDKTRPSHDTLAQLLLHEDAITSPISHVEFTAESKLEIVTEDGRLEINLALEGMKEDSSLLLGFNFDENKVYRRENSGFKQPRFELLKHKNINTFEFATFKSSAGEDNVVVSSRGMTKDKFFENEDLHVASFKSTHISQPIPVFLFTPESPPDMTEVKDTLQPVVVKKRAVTPGRADLRETETDPVPAEQQDQEREKTRPKIVPEADKSAVTAKNYENELWSGEDAIDLELKTSAIVQVPISHLADKSIKVQVAPILRSKWDEDRIEKMKSDFTEKGGRNISFSKPLTGVCHEELDAVTQIILLNGMHRFYAIGTLLEEGKIPDDTQVVFELTKIPKESFDMAYADVNNCHTNKDVLLIAGRIMIEECSRQKYSEADEIRALRSIICAIHNKTLAESNTIFSDQLTGQDYIRTNFNFRGNRISEYVAAMFLPEDIFQICIDMAENCRRKWTRPDGSTKYALWGAKFWTAVNSRVSGQYKFPLPEVTMKLNIMRDGHINSEPKKIIKNLYDLLPSAKNKRRSQPAVTEGPAPPKMTRVETGAEEENILSTTIQRMQESNPLFRDDSSDDEVVETVKSSRRKTREHTIPLVNQEGMKKKISDDVLFVESKIAESIRQDMPILITISDNSPLTVNPSAFFDRFQYHIDSGRVLFLFFNKGFEYAAYNNNILLYFGYFIKSPLGEGERSGKFGTVVVCGDNFHKAKFDPIRDMYFTSEEAITERLHGLLEEEFMFAQSY